MPHKTLIVRPAPFSIDDPWRVPSICDRVRLRRATDGTAPRLSTTVALYFDRDFLTAVFTSADDHVVSTYYEHDAPLYKEDVVELFLSPSRISEYFELEVSPAGTTFDARIESPDGVRTTMRADLGWTCEGLFAGVRKLTESDSSTSVDTVIRVPFSALKRPAPAEGEAWRANFFRIDRHPAFGDEYSAWQPTLRVPADFHVPAVFGSIVFTSAAGDGRTAEP